MRQMAPFRYWGAKVRMAPWVIERLPDHDHFIEGCAGSAAILAAKPPVAYETVNDTYGEVVNFFRVLRNPETAERLIDMVAFTPYAQAEFRDALAFDGDDPTERSYAFFVRMMMAVVPGRTGWQYSSTGATGKKANKPGRWATMPEHLRRTAERFERVQVTDWPVVELLDRMDKPGVLVLVDPPYLDETRPTSTGSSSGYAHDKFDHDEFLGAVHRLTHATVAVTHYPHPLYDDAMPTVGDYLSHRNNPTGTGRDDRFERMYLWTPGGPR